MIPGSAGVMAKQRLRASRRAVEKIEEIIGERLNPEATGKKFQEALKLGTERNLDIMISTATAEIAKKIGPDRRRRLGFRISPKELTEMSRLKPDEIIREMTRKRQLQYAPFVLEVREHRLRLRDDTVGASISAIADVNPSMVSAMIAKLDVEEIVRLRDPNRSPFMIPSDAFQGAAANIVAKNFVKVSGLDKAALKQLGISPRQLGAYADAELIHIRGAAMVDYIRDNASKLQALIGDDGAKRLAIIADEIARVQAAPQIRQAAVLVVSGVVVGGGAALITSLFTGDIFTQRAVGIVGGAIGAGAIAATMNRFAHAWARNDNVVSITRQFLRAIGRGVNSEVILYGQLLNHALEDDRNRSAGGFLAGPTSRMPSSLSGP
jgi:hypothetical protein